VIDPVYSITLVGVPDGQEPGYYTMVDRNLAFTVLHVLKEYFSNIIFQAADDSQTVK
jgi:hypothetical protein